MTQSYVWSWLSDCVISVSKESRVLSGRSLMVLAREVEQGLTLAIYLDLNDSTITGMGFDALAKGQSLIDITYRILMLWKRKSSKLKEGQIDQLVQALEEMGRRDVAEILVAKHTANEELTPDCFGHESWSTGYQLGLYMTDKSTLVQVMAWCRKAPSHYLRKCWHSPGACFDIKPSVQSTESRELFMMPTLPLSVVPRVIVMCYIMTTCAAASDDKVGIMSTFGFSG